MRIFDNPNYNFVKYRWHAVIASLIIIGIGLGVFLTRGINLGIDFAGGANIVLKFKEPVPLGELRAKLPAATIQQYGREADNSVLIRLPQQKREGDYAGQVVEQLHKDMNPEAAQKHDLNYLGSDRLAALLLQTNPENKLASSPETASYYAALAKRIIDRRSELGIFTDMNQVASVPGASTAATVLRNNAVIGRFNVLNQETVGPQVGAQLQQKAILAILLSALAMGAYIWIRFDIGFGLAAIACILHDVLIAMTFLLLMNLEFSLNVVAALLTIVGYSINDNVVMYDRVRENKRKIKKPLTLAEHLNLAINQTLSRTILTAGTVFLVLVAMLVFGGEVIRGFSWILTIGVITGTYSTLLIVPAVAIAWDRFTSKRRPAAPAAARVEAPPREEPRKAARRAV
ncbi:MAG TPA: protein translocase subunit SecF [Thermoanaerobaculia bacterium]